MKESQKIWLEIMNLKFQCAQQKPNSIKCFINFQKKEETPFNKLMWKM